MMVLVAVEDFLGSLLFALTFAFYKTTEVRMKKHYSEYFTLDQILDFQTPVFFTLLSSCQLFYRKTELFFSLLLRISLQVNERIW